MLGSIVLLLCAGAPMPQQEQVTLRVQVESLVRGREVTVSEVATVTGTNPELVQRVSSHVLSAAPAPGYSRLLYGYRIEQALERAFVDLDVVMTGERSVRIAPLSERIEVEAVQGAAQAAIEAAAQQGDFEFSPMGGLTEVYVPAGIQPARLVARAPSEGLKTGSVNVPVEIWVDDRLYRTRWVAFAVTEWQTVPVMATDVAPGTTLVPAHFVVERIARQPGQTTAPLPVEAAVGSSAARGLRAGQPLTDLDVHRPLAIVAGNQIYVEVRAASVTARSLCVALDSGSVGDRIRVELLSSGHEMRGVVKSRDMVVVEVSSRR